MSFLVRSGNVASGAIANAAVLSGSIGSGQIGSGHFASGLIAGLQSGGAGLVSGQVSSGFLGNNSVLSGNIGSGQVSTPHFASGSIIDDSRTSIIQMLAAELISGVKAVSMINDPSGSTTTPYARIAMANTSGRMPAIGMVVDDVASGQLATVYTQGAVYNGSGFSGNLNIGFGSRPPIPAYVGASGTLQNNAASFSSGMVQAIGWFISSSGNFTADGVLIQPNTTASGFVTFGMIGNEAIVDGNISSGAVGQFKLGNQAILSGNLRSGLITTGAQQLIDQQVTIAGETISGGNAGVLLGVTVQNSLSGVAIVLVANPAIASRRPAFGVVTKNYASGDPVEVITNGILAWPHSVNTNLGQPFFVGNSGNMEGINLPTASGAWIQPMGIALSRGLGGNESGTLLIQPMVWRTEMITFGLIGSGVIFGFGQSGLSTPARNIASGSIGGFDIAAKAINSGQMGDQFINFTFITAGGVLSGNIASGNISRSHLASGTNSYGVEYTFNAGELISGVKAVAFSTDSPINGFVVRAERQSGGRLPVIGVTVSGAASGQACTVVARGFIADYASGMMASGATGRIMYVGSGGLIVNTSGFAGGASSGGHLISGSVAQKVGVYMVDGSGLVRGIMVNPSPEITSGVLSTAQGNF